MGWFSCDHKWERHGHRAKFIGDSVPQHKCEKCGKVEDCNKNGIDHDGDGGPISVCTKCGNY